jgi:hypothetical protein
LVPIVAASASCAGRPKDDARQSQEALTSWKATADLVARLHTSGAIPDRFAHQAQDAIKPELRAAEQRFEAAKHGTETAQ